MSPDKIKNKSERRGGYREGAGRPKGAVGRATAEHKATLSEMARKFTDLALKTLVEVCGDASQTGSARVTAAHSILDRAYGKPAQTVEHEGSLTLRHEDAIGDLE